jgi:hypothetical protein
MSTSIHLVQERDLTDPEDPEGFDYKLTTTFFYPGTPPYPDPDPLPAFKKELILIWKKTADEEDDEYKHICTVGDINRYGIDRETTEVGFYYRVSSWVTYFTNLEDLTAAADVQQEKTQFVVTDWENYVGTDPFPKTIYNGDISQS